jgi:hypothetical protein
VQVKGNSKSLGHFAPAPCMEKPAGLSEIVKRAGIGPQNNAEIHQSSTYLLVQLLDCQCCHGVGWLTQACIRADPATTVMAAPLQTLRSGSQRVICKGWQELPMPCQGLVHNGKWIQMHAVAL